MKNLVVVMAHGNGIAAFRRHEGYWKKHHEKILVVCPENDPVESSYETVKVGEAMHNGRGSIERIKYLFSWLHDTDCWDKCIIYEYDSFCLDPIKWNERRFRGFYGNVKKNKESPRMMAPRYANPPWTFDGDSFRKMAQVMGNYPDLYEDGEADRYLSALAMLANVPIFDYSPKGFSRGTINTKKSDIEDMKTAIYCGATMIHGVKQEWVLRAAEQFYDENHLPHAKEIASRFKSY